MAHISQHPSCQSWFVTREHRELLVILPKLYEELCCYPVSMIEFDKPAFEKHTSPYGVDVFRKMQAYPKTGDIHILDKWLKEICTSDANGFVDFVDSPDMIVKKYNKRDAWWPRCNQHHENIKLPDDLILKYGNNLILDNDMEWTIK